MSAVSAEEKLISGNLVIGIKAVGTGQFEMKLDAGNCCSVGRQGVRDVLVSVFIEKVLYVLSVVRDGEG